MLSAVAAVTPLGPGGFEHSRLGGGGVLRFFLGFGVRASRGWGFRASTNFRDSKRILDTSFLDTVVIEAVRPCKRPTKDHCTVLEFEP